MGGRSTNAPEILFIEGPIRLELITFSSKDFFSTAYRVWGMMYWIDKLSDMEILQLLAQLEQEGLKANYFPNERERRQNEQNRPDGP